MYFLKEKHHFLIIDAIQIVKGLMPFEQIGSVFRLSNFPEMGMVNVQHSNTFNIKQD
jgi:hypothetical protein